jgi:hypothetical protein
MKAGAEPQQLFLPTEDIAARFKAGEIGFELRPIGDF